MNTLDGMTDQERRERLRREHARLDTEFAALEVGDEYTYRLPGNPALAPDALTEFEAARQALAGEADTAF